MEITTQKFRELMANGTYVVANSELHQTFHKFSQDAFKKLKGDNKELFIVKGANHVDLYDGGDKNAIPFDKIESFYKENLK